MAGRRRAGGGVGRVVRSRDDLVASYDTLFWLFSCEKPTFICTDSLPDLPVLLYTGPVYSLHARTIPTQPPPPPPINPLPPLIDPENRTGNTHQGQQIAQPQRLRLKNPLQERQIDDRHLARQAAGDSVIEHLIGKQADLAAQDALGLAAAGQGVEHVEEDEAGEGHGGVAGRDGVVDGHLADVDGERAEHDDRGRGEDALDEAARQDAGGFGAWGPGHDGGVDGLDAEGLGRRAVHEDVFGWLWLAGTTGSDGSKGGMAY